MEPLYREIEDFEENIYVKFVSYEINPTLAAKLWNELQRTIGTLRELIDDELFEQKKELDETASRTDL